jgi:hypothetical protein
VAVAGDDHGSPCRHESPCRLSDHAIGNRGDLPASHPARPSSARRHQEQTKTEAEAASRVRPPPVESRRMAERAAVGRRRCRPVRQGQGLIGEVVAWKRPFRSLEACL